MIKGAPEELSVLKFCLDRYKTQNICDKAVDGCLSGLKFVPNWFATNKLLKNSALFGDDKIIFINDDANNIKLLVAERVFLVHILVKSVSMMVILIKMILKLLIMLEFLLGVKNTKYKKKIQAKK